MTLHLPLSMFRRFTPALATFFLAFLILSISIFKSARVSYTFYPTVPGSDISIPADTPLVLGEDAEVKIDYELPYAGKIHPDNSLWFLKATRDKLWLGLTTDQTKVAKLLLLFADKRLVSALHLFEKGKPELGFSTLSKGEKYLESAAKALEENTNQGMDTTEFAQALSKASLKHKEVIEEIKKVAPEDAKPKINEVENYAEDSYKTARDSLQSQGEVAPITPLDWD